MSAEPYTVWKTGTEVLSLIGLGTVLLGFVAFVVACYMVYQRLWGKTKVARRAPRAASAGTPKPKATPRRRLAAAPSLVPHFHIPATPSVRNLLSTFNSHFKIRILIESIYMLSAQHYGSAPVKAEPAADR